jgi:hypothetical protein
VSADQDLDGAVSYALGARLLGASALTQARVFENLETLPKSSEAFIYVATNRLMAKRLTHS